MGPDIYAETPKDKRARKAIEIILLLNHKLNKLCGMPIKLSDAGVTEDQINDIAKAALNDGAMLPNPKDLNLEDIKTILKEAF